ncbi:MAG: RluA family pseudouridine synthase [Bdellovibrionota bacterium]
MAHHFIIEEENANSTVEHYLLRHAKLGPRSALKKAFRNDQVRLNQRPVARLAPLSTGDKLEVIALDVFKQEQLKLVPNPRLTPEIVIKTEDFIVINKPAGMSAHPLKPTETDTALQALGARYPETLQTADPTRPLEGLLAHRIDTGTSGLLVCARSLAARRRLKEVWKKQGIKKVYLAWVEGNLEIEKRICFFLSHSEKSKKRMIASVIEPRGLRSWPAETSFRSLYGVNTAYGPSTLVLAQIHTGVTHQIRATLAALGHAVLKDQVYSSSSNPLKGLAERSEKLSTETKQLFSKCSSTLQPNLRPNESLLPERGFFLHALWLSSEEEKAFHQGIFAPLPAHFKA